MVQKKLVRMVWGFQLSKQVSCVVLFLNSCHSYLLTSFDSLSFLNLVLSEVVQDAVLVSAGTELIFFPVAAVFWI